MTTQALAGITASWQHMRHAACDFAKHMMEVALAQSGVRPVDGATNVMPVAPHKARPAHRSRTTSCVRTAIQVHRAWSGTSTM
jgi:hypothetical protein